MYTEIGYIPALYPPKRTVAGVWGVIKTGVHRWTGVHPLHTGVNNMYRWLFYLWIEYIRRQYRSDLDRLADR